MPLHDVGYRAWEGERTSLFGRWSIVAKTGIRLAFASTWLNRTLILSFVPALVFGVIFFFFEQSIVTEEYRSFFSGMVMASGAPSELAVSVARDPESVRHEVWSALLMTFFRNPQAIAMLVVVALVAPKLIAADLRNRGYLLYFSRPLSILGYIFGKALVIWAFLALITTIPALFLYVLGLCLSPDVTVILTTWDLPFRIVAASLVLMVPVSMVALACSAMTIETRYAAFAWFAIWTIGWLSYTVLFFGETAGRSGRPGAARFERIGGGEEDIPTVQILRQSDWELLSPYHTLGRVQQYVFGVYPDEKSIIPYILVLLFITAACFWFVRRRILARLQA